MSKNWVVLGHRGAKGHEPENTLRAIRKGIELGVHAVEIDVQQVESELVVIHDVELDRTTNGKGKVVDCSLEYIRSLDAGAGEKVPLLSEVIAEVAGKIWLNVEIKSTSCATILARQLREAVNTEQIETQQVLVSSFDHLEISAFKKQAPEFRVAPLLYGVPHDLAACGGALGAWAVNIAAEFAEPRLIEDIRKRGMKIFVYTVNDEEEAKYLQSLGVDGVFSDFPERVSL